MGYMPPMKTREIVAGDREEVLKLLELCFGVSPNHAKGFDRWLMSDDAQLLGTFDATSCVAFGSVSLQDFRKTFESFRPWGHAHGALLESGETHGSYNVLAVHPSLRRSGLGNAIAEAQMNWFRQRGCDALVGVAWIHPGPDRSQGLFRRFDYELVGTSSTFYPEMHRDQPCPYCGKNCTCEAELYVRDLRSAP